MENSTDNQDLYRRQLPSKKRNPYNNHIHDYVVVAYMGEWSQKSGAMSHQMAKRTMGEWIKTKKYPGARYRIDPV